MTGHDAYVGTCDGFGYGDIPPPYYRYCGYCSCGWTSHSYPWRAAHYVVAAHVDRYGGDR